MNFAGNMPTEQEIQDQIEQAMIDLCLGGRNGGKYEEGVINALNWILGEIVEPPIEE